MTPEEIQLEEAAFQFAIAHRRPLAKKIVDTEVFIPERAPLTVFMAGSPGAGKTEVSKAMVEALEKGGLDVGGRRVLRIDPDDFRELIPGYSGGNSYLFQRAVTKILEKVLDRAFKKRVSFILDGTMSNLGVAKRNIDRVLNGKSSGPDHVRLSAPRISLGVCEGAGNNRRKKYSHGEVCSTIPGGAEEYS